MDEENGTITNSLAKMASGESSDTEVKKSPSPVNETGVNENNVDEKGDAGPDEEESSDDEEQSESESGSASKSESKDEEEDDEEQESEQEELEGLEGALNVEQLCRLCGEKYKQPRVLHCLHVFCTSCLEKLLEETKEDAQSKALPLKSEGLTCTVCKHHSPLSGKGVEDLPLDTVMASLIDLAAMNDPQIDCTSCKFKVNAVARCSDCASFLCQNCTTAHQFMRCFENHKVNLRAIHLKLKSDHLSTTTVLYNVSRHQRRS